MADENLLIANFNTSGELNLSVGNANTQITKIIGPQSFVPVTEAQVGPLPWTVTPPKPFKSQDVNSLPAIVAYGQFKPSGAFGLGYLTAVIYPPKA